MKKKILTVFLALICALCCAVGFAACGGEQQPSDDKTTVAVSSVKLNKNTLELKVGESETLTATVSPDNAADKTVVWTSSAQNVVTVTGGVVKAVSAGNATVTATAGGKSATCAVTVAAASSTVEVSKVTLSETAISLSEGQSKTLNASIESSDATDGTVVWSSSNTNVATVSGGVVTAVSAGNAVITAAAGGKSATCTVTVSSGYIGVESIKLNKTTLTLEAGDEETLTVSFTPENAADKTLKWKSLNTAIATVDASGKVKAVSAGNTAVIVDCGNLRESCAVTVTEKTVKVESVSLNKTSLTLEIGDEETLIVTVLPENATDRTVEWSVNGTAVTVAAGKVTAAELGTATVTATGGNGKTASCTVTVTRAATKGLSYTKNFSKTAWIVGIGTATDKDIVVPAVHENLPVVSVKSFIGLDITSVYLPEGIMFIEDNAFEDCSDLTQINFPSTLSSIGYSAFKGCSSLENVTLPKGLTEISGGAFENTAIKSIALPDGVKVLAADTFKDCSSLESVTFGSGITTVNFAFTGCVNIREVRAQDLAKWLDVKFVKSSDGSAYSNPLRYAEKFYVGGKLLTTFDMPAGIRQIRDGVFYGFKGLTSVSIPQNEDFGSFLGNNTFQGCVNLNAITFNGRCVIGVETFAGCTGLEKASLPSFVDIGERSFAGCSNLTEITVGGDSGTIGSEAFEGCPITTAEVHQRMLRYYSADLFSAGTLENLTVSGGHFDETNVKDYFAGIVGVKNITLSDSIAACDIDAFKGCAFVSATVPMLAVGALPATVTKLNVTSGIASNGRFKHLTALKSLTLSETVTGITATTFDGCTAEEYSVAAEAVDKLPKDKVKSLIVSGGENIAEKAMQSCKTLESVTVSANLKTVGGLAFANCSALKAVYITDASAWCGITFANAQSNPLYNAKKLYLDGELAVKLVIDEGVTEIKSFAFYNCNTLTSVTVPASLKKIGNDAFKNCSKLKEWHISSVAAWCGVEIYNSFSSPLNGSCEPYLNGTPITDLVIPAGVEKINADTFSTCNKLITVNISEGVKEIGDSAFYNCTKLERITIPVSVTTIRSYAFQFCKSLTDIYYKGTKSQWAKITKENLWDMQIGGEVIEGVTAEYTVHCSDGDITQRASQ